MLILGAPTNLGNRPYEDSGEGRLTTLGPARLREHRLVERLRGKDLGDVTAAPYRDFVRPPGGIRNEDLVRDHVLRIASALELRRAFTLILGGDCSVLLGSLLGLDRSGEFGLVYADAHTDFGTEETSSTGGVAGMDLALATGRGRSELARLRGGGPLLRDENIVAFGIREGDFEGTGIRTVFDANEAVAKIADRPFFIHVDADVLDPGHLPFVDSPTPGGVSPGELVEFLRPLAHHPNARGMEVTIYDPRHDHDGRGAGLLVDLLVSVFD